MSWNSWNRSSELAGEEAGSGEEIRMLTDGWRCADFQSPKHDRDLSWPGHIFFSIFVNPTFSKDSVYITKYIQ